MIKTTPVFDPKLERVDVHRYAFKLISENNTSRFGKGEWLKAAVVEVKTASWPKLSQLAKQ